MSFSFDKLQEVLSEWLEVQIPHETENDSLMERIRQVLMNFANKGCLQKADFRVLIRHLLLRKSISSEGEAVLRLPADSNWPSLSDWEESGVLAEEVGTDFLLKAQKWRPKWLEENNSGVFSDSFSKKSVRVDSGCASDPFIMDATEYSKYSCLGQREAVRAAFLMPFGHTLIVNLPTGSGKSLVAQAPALVHSRDGHLTLFVVPTVALAIDQERKMQEYFCSANQTTESWPLAWYGGSSKEVRSEIYRRMRDGTQKILFVSPEALTTSLLETVFEVASSGMLRYLVIDEAHLINQWGDGFRPEFQLLAGMRTSLLSKLEKEGVGDPFRTLLLSATFTPETIGVLANLFGPPDRVQMISAVHLRPEPQYWFSKANSFQEKEERILEALNHAPRPFILYVTKREDASKWLNILRKNNYQRIEQFDGATPNPKREKIIDSWINNKLDGIVATSAFGVGMDKNDVRTIIHATVPETLDRYYQEVGRGGRDGKSSISLLVYEASDLKLADSMASKKLITTELGFKRWNDMYKHRMKFGQEHDEDIFRVNLNVAHQELTGTSDQNVKWNVRTLLLMVRAGLIELLVEPVDPNNVSIDYSENEFPESQLAEKSLVKVRILQGDHLMEKSWEETINLSRNDTIAASTKSLELMKEVLHKSREISDILAELYTNRSPKWTVHVTKVCGGCPVDRSQGILKNYYHVPFAVPIHKVSPVNLNSWKELFGDLDPNYVQVFYRTDEERLIIPVIQWLIKESGVQEVCASDTSVLVQSAKWRNLYQIAPSGVVIQRNLQQLNDEPYSPLARVTFFDDSVSPHEINQVVLIRRPMHLVFYPSNTCDPNHSERLLSATATNSINLKSFYLKIRQ
jgi:ATP-dependent DNA helicase RecQ